MVEIMAVHRADIVKAQLLEQRTAGHHTARIFLGFFGSGAATASAHVFSEVLRKIAQAAIALRGDRARKIVRHRAHRRGDRHLVVIQDHDQACAHVAGVVHRLIGHAGAHRAITDHRDHLEIIAGKVARGRHADPRRDRGRAMRRTERIVFALRTFGETGQTAGLTDGADTVTTSL